MNLDNVKINLKRLRKEKNLTYRALSELSGVSFIAIRNIEIGKNYPHPKSIYKLAKAFGCEYEDLLK